MGLGWGHLTPEGKRYFSELKKLEKLEVQVGFQEGDSDAQGQSLAEIAASNELGTSSKPARPFMRQSFERHEKELQNACNQANAVVSNGGTAEEALNELGVFVKGLVQTEIIEGGFAPNSPITIARKGSSTPLVDTGTMRQSVNYVIKERSK